MENKLKDKVREEITIMFEGILDFVQVSCPEGNWKPLRSKILKKSNDCIRSLENYIDNEITTDEYQSIKKEFYDKHRGIK